MPERGRIPARTDPDQNGLLDRWGTMLAVLVSVVTLVASVFGSMYTG